MFRYIFLSSILQAYKDYYKKKEVKLHFCSIWFRRLGLSFQTTSFMWCHMLQKSVAILPIVARSSLRRIANTLPATRSYWYVLLSRIDSRPAVCQHSRVVVHWKKTWRSSSVVFWHIGQCTSQSTCHWYNRTRVER
jgi:hypothetical protein